MKLVSCRSSDAWKYDVAPKLLAKLWIPGLTYIRSIGKDWLTVLCLRVHPYAYRLPNIELFHLN
jgi:hypothetical protein